MGLGLWVRGKGLGLRVQGFRRWPTWRRRCMAPTFDHVFDHELDRGALDGEGRVVKHVVKRVIKRVVKRCAPVCVQGPGR